MKQNVGLSSTPLNIIENFPIFTTSPTNIGFIKKNFGSQSHYEKLIADIKRTLVQWGAIEYSSLYNMYSTIIHQIAHYIAYPDDLPAQVSSSFINLLASNNSTSSLYNIIRPSITGKLPSVLRLSRRLFIPGVNQGYTLYIWCNNQSLIYHSIAVHMYILMPWCRDFIVTS